MGVGDAEHVAHRVVGVTQVLPGRAAACGHHLLQAPALRRPGVVGVAVDQRAIGGIVGHAEQVGVGAPHRVRQPVGGIGVQHRLAQLVGACGVGHRNDLPGAVVSVVSDFAK